MHRIVMSALFALCLASSFGGSAQAQGFSGNYVGTYTASKLPGQTLNIGLYFFQPNQHTMIANYATGSGVAGACIGTVNGNVAILTCTNSTTTCPGTYRGRYIFTGINVTWTYVGRDCLGAEQGSGNATKK
jgi:hypothetical protein